MAKVTSKYQVTVPKIIVERYGIQPGDEIQWVPAGEVIRVVLTGKTVEIDNKDSRLRLFDQATERHRPSIIKSKRKARERGWTREELYARGRSR